MWNFKSNYTKYLELQIEKLEVEKKEAQARNEKLVEALVPILRRMNEPQSTSPSVNAAKHHIVRGENSATCTCTWKVKSEDPAVLQEMITAHYRENIHPAQAVRKSWQQARQLLEEQAEIETTKESA